jgi:dTDP-4-dehydrorhamnose reductase
MKSALITGIAGQDGRHLAKLLLSKNYTVYGMLNGQREESSKLLSSELPNVIQVNGDLADSSSLISVLTLTQPDEIYNLAAISFVGMSFTQPELTSNITGLGVLRLLEAIRIIGLADKTKMYQASSSEMFGRVRETPQTEGTPFHPRSPYGVAKCFAHYACVNYREAYDMYAMTAAHTVLPIPSYVRVTNLANKKSVVVRVNDRGPFIGNRLIDLSYTAAYKLGLATAGSGMVEVELIIPGSPEPGKTSGASPNIAPAAVQPVAPAKPLTTGFFVQLAAFSSKENADAYLQKIREQKELQGEPLQIRENAGLFRIHAGPYPSDAAARQSAERAARLLNIRPLVSAY